MTTEPPTAHETRAAVEHCLLIYLILEPCQQLQAARGGDGELVEIVQQLRAAMTQSVEYLPVSAAELAVPIGTHAADILGLLEGKSPILKVLAVLYMTRSLVAADRFALAAESPFDLATVRLISFLEANYAARWDAYEKEARRWARTLQTAMLKRALFGGRACQRSER